MKLHLRTVHKLSQSPGRFQKELLSSNIELHVKTVDEWNDALKEQVCFKSLLETDMLFLRLSA